MTAGHLDSEAIASMIVKLCETHRLDFGEYNLKDRSQAISGDGLLQENVTQYIKLYSEVDPWCRIDIGSLKVGLQTAMQRSGCINSSGCTAAAFTQLFVKQSTVIFLHVRRLAQRPELLELALRRMSASNGKRLEDLVGMNVRTALDHGTASASASTSSPAEQDALFDCLSSIFSDAAKYAKSQQPETTPEQRAPAAKEKAKKKKKPDDNEKKKPNDAKPAKPDDAQPEPDAKIDAKKKKKPDDKKKKKPDEKAAKPAKIERRPSPGRMGYRPVVPRYPDVSAAVLSCLLPNR